MKLTVNGKDIDFNMTNVQHLIELYNLKPKGVVVERNGEIVKRENFELEELKEGDVIEIVRFVGGG